MFIPSELKHLIKLINQLCLDHHVFCAPDFVYLMIQRRTYIGIVWELDHLPERSWDRN